MILIIVVIIAALLHCSRRFLFILDSESRAA
jgi:hypothetical protein